MRYVKLPVDFTWLECPIRSEPNGDDIVTTLLPMYDPHELLEYLWTSGRIRVSEDDIKILGSQKK